MKNSALKTLSLMTLTLAIACGHDPASEVTEIETVVLDGNRQVSRKVVEIDYRNGNEVDMVSTYRDGELREQLSYFYDMENNLVTRIDTIDPDSNVEKWLAEYNNDSKFPSFDSQVVNEADGVSLSYANGNLVSQREPPGLNVRYIYNGIDRLVTAKTDFSVQDFRWNGDLLTSTRTTNEGWRLPSSSLNTMKPVPSLLLATIPYTTEIFYDDEGRVHEVVTYYGGLSSRTITTYPVH